jgi:hypothetical protein
VRRMGCGYGSTDARVALESAKDSPEIMHGNFPSKPYRHSPRPR